MYGIQIVAFVASVGKEKMQTFTDSQPMADPGFLKLVETITREEVDNHLPIRCPNPEAVRPIVCQSHAALILWIDSTYLNHHICLGRLSNA